MALGAALLPSALLAQAAPAVVASSATTLTTGLKNGRAVLDACGNVYVNQSSNGIIQINASTGAVTTVVANTNGYNNGNGIAIDQAKANIYFPTPAQWYSSSFTKASLVNCAVGAQNVFANNVGALTGYYYGTANDIATDTAGDVFFVPTAGGTGLIVEESAAGTASLAQSSWPTNLTALASDPAGNLYFNDGTATIYRLAAPYTAKAAAFASGFNKVAGLSFDPQGNLYIADSGASLVYEIPLESTGLNPSHQAALVSVSLTNTVAVDASQTLSLSNYSGSLLQEHIGFAAAPNTAQAATGTFAVNYVFNTATTPTAFKAYSGTSTTTPFTAGTGCTVGTAYAAGSTCSLSVNYTPTTVGLQKGALAFSTAAGVVNTAFLSAIGLGGSITVDPGVVTASTAKFVKPSGAAVGPGGIVYVLDSTANTLTQFAAGGTGAGVLVGTGTFTLSAPNSVAVDGAGDVFIADTGNNRILEIPAVAGVLNNAGTVTLSPVVKGPKGVATDGQGGLYIADTGDNNLLFVPAINGVLNFAASRSLGSGLSAPSAVTVDPGGNVFLAETGANDVLEFAAPVGSTAQVKVASGLNAPSALATDASSSLFVVDSGSQSIFRFPNVGGNLGTKSLAGSTVAAPTGLATDSAGNLYVTDATNALFEVVSRTTGALNFGGWNVGTTSTSLSGTISSSGNQSVVFATPSYAASGNTAAGFKVTGDTCAGMTVTAGSGCSITANFTPPVTELNAQENLTFASNAVGAGSVLQLIGTGANIKASTLSLVLTSPATTGPLNVGVSTTFTATINTGGNTAVPGGSINFLVNGTQVGTAKVTNGAASITLPSGLPAGAAVVVTANYTGDSINYSGSTASITEVVNALPDSLTLAITTPYNNPPSALDVTANTKGPSIPLIATLTVQGNIIPAGFVTFYSGTTTLGSASVLPGTGGTFQATLNTTALRAGTTNVVENNVYLTAYGITAVYSGDTSYGPSTSNVSPVTVVSGPTFTITPANPAITATTTKAGGPASGSTTLTVNSYGGWTGILNFACSGLPAYSTCAPFPGGPLVAFSTPAATVPATTVNFIIDTNVTPTGPTASSMIWWMSGLAGLMLLVLRRKVQRAGFLRSGQLFSALGVLLLLAGSVAGVSGCSSGGYQFVTPAGTSAVSVKVSAAQLVPGTTTAATNPADVNTPTLHVTLTIQ